MPRHRAAEKAAGTSEQAAEGRADKTRDWTSCSVR